jgi:transposase
MGRLEDEALTAMTVLLKGGHTQSAVARLLGVTEGSVRYHRRRRESGATDGRSRQVSAASAHADAIAHWRDQQTDGRINLAALHGWLVREHGYAASLKSVQRYWQRTFPAPAIRARRRVETPAGAQAQVDWAEYPGMVLGGEVVDLVALVMTLSWSRKRAVVWARSKDMLSWQACHTACFRRLGGVPAVLRIDNVKTGVSRGAGSWGEVNPAYRRYAVQLKFHVDACQPRQPQAKGKSLPSRMRGSSGESATSGERTILTARCSTASQRCRRGPMRGSRTAPTGCVARRPGPAWPRRGTPSGGC